MTVLRVAALQLAPTDDRARNLEAAAAMIDAAAADGARVMVLPELFAVPFVPAVPGRADYLQHAEPLDGPSNQLVAQKSTEHRITIVSSIFEATPVPGVYHNTACVFQEGDLLLEYRKSHLPLSNNFPEKYYFRPGDEAPSVVDTGEVKLGTIICYERHFPELGRAVALAGGEVMAVPIAAATAYSRTSFDIELKAHAIFNCMYVIASNRIGAEGSKHYFGGSAIYDPDGGVVAQAADHGGDEVVVGDIDLDQLAAKRISERPFLRDRRPALYRS